MINSFMKYVIFTVALVFGVPVMAGLVAMSAKMKHLLFTVMVVSLIFGAKVSINLMSMEYYRGPVRGYEITLTDLIALGLIIGMLMRAGGRIVMFPRFFFPFLAFFLFSVVNVVMSETKIFGWFVIWQLFRMGMIYWCVFNFFASAEPEEWDGAVAAVMRGFALMGIIMALMTLKQKYLDGIYRTNVFFDHSNTVPSFVLIIICLLLVWALSEPRLTLFRHLLTLGAALGLVFAVLGTSSRAGIVTAAGAVVCGLVIANIRRRRGAAVTPRTRAATVLLGIVMLVAALMVLDTVIDRFLNAPESSEQARGEFEVAAEMMADDYPMGVGLNQYSHVLTMQSRYREHFSAMKNETEGGVAHHIYLLTASEMGWFGMYFFIAIIALLEITMLAAGLPMKSLEQKLLVGLSVGFAVLYAIGLLEWVLRQSPVLYQFSIATGFGQALTAKVRKKLNRPAARTAAEAADTDAGSAVRNLPVSAREGRNPGRLAGRISMAERAALRQTVPPAAGGAD